MLWVGDVLTYYKEDFRGLIAGPGGKIQLEDAIKIHTQLRAVKIIRLNGRRFYFGSVDGFIRASKHEYDYRSVVYYA